MQFPSYPLGLVRIGVSGEVLIEFVVSPQGTATVLQVKASDKEFEAAVREAVQNWRFEPGVDLKYRMPTKTRMSLTVKFYLKED